MKTSAVFLLAAFVAGSATSSDTDDRYKQLKGEYSVYSGELGDQAPPTKKESKISIIVVGSAAKAMFESMGSDDKHACVADPGDRSRTKRQLSCSYSRKDGYVCYIGFDLKTGESIAGGMC